MAIISNLSLRQLVKGVNALNEIETCLIQDGTQHEVELLCNVFYSTIPHNTGRKAPPIISLDTIGAKKEELYRLINNIKTRG
jgi:hypothetical protein